MSSFKITKRSNGTLDVETIIEGETMTQQQFKDDCDVNSILEKYRKTGSISHLNNNQPQYADFSGYQDFQSSLHMVIEAQAKFDALPAHVRQRFGNDPAMLVDFLSNSENSDEAIKLGLKVAPAPQAQPNDDKTTTSAPKQAEATQP